MPDITMCQDLKCPSRTICYRYCAEPDKRQSYFAESTRVKGQMRCSEYWDYRVHEMRTKSSRTVNKKARKK
jgi:hypothetical protein